jgi:hypothetical protein
MLLGILRQFPRNPNSKELALRPILGGRIIPDSSSDKNIALS